MQKKNVLEFNVQLRNRIALKYMHFNSSCSYCSLSYMLLKYDIDVTDVDIALKMKLPYLFNKDDDGYSAGPMLQNHKWFNLYLNPLGLEMIEERVPKDKIIKYLLDNQNSMIGIKTNFGKHAVVFIGIDNDKMIFFNPKWEETKDKDILEIDKNELLDRIDDIVMVASLRRCDIKKVNYNPFLLKSIKFLNDYYGDVVLFVNENDCIDEYKKKLDILFRPLLLDTLSVLKLTNEYVLIEAFNLAQRQLLDYIRGKTKTLDKKLFLGKIKKIITNYINIITRQISVL